MTGRQNFKRRDIIISKIKKSIDFYNDLCDRDEKFGQCCKTLSETMKACGKIFIINII